MMLVQVCECPADSCIDLLCPNSYLEKKIKPGSNISKNRTLCY